MDYIVEWFLGSATYVRDAHVYGHHGLAGVPPRKSWLATPTRILTSRPVLDLREIGKVLALSLAYSFSHNLLENRRGQTQAQERR